MTYYQILDLSGQIILHELSRLQVGVMSADTTDDIVLSADTAGVLSADATNVLSEDKPCFPDPQLARCAAPLVLPGTKVGDIPKTRATPSDPSV